MDADDFNSKFEPSKADCWRRQHNFNSSTASTNPSFSNHLEEFIPFPIKKIFIFDGFNASGLFGDVAVAEVLIPEVITPVGIIADYKYDTSKDVFLVGFEEAEEVSNHFDGVYTQILKPEECLKFWDFIVPKMHVCVGDEHHNIAMGDSGGPMLVQGSNLEWFQIGIASFGSRDLTTQPSPAVYMKTDYFCDWIGQVTNNQAKCIKSPFESEAAFQRTGNDSSASTRIQFVILGLILTFGIII
uniref:Peptidase S1 domain-containing protein n=1 Tax=Panagrolaimus sp. JU765 TaxID=591449 RepID=A0AC34RC53_9BILA